MTQFDANQKYNKHIKYICKECNKPMVDNSIFPLDRQVACFDCWRFVYFWGVLR